MKDGSQNSGSNTTQNIWSTSLALWYSLVTPPEPLTTANFSQRERIRRSRFASLAMLVLIFLAFTLLAQAIIAQNLIQVIEVIITLWAYVLILFLNRRGFVEIAGILALIVVYTIGTLTMFNYPGKLTIDNLLLLGFTIIPYMIAIAFFSSRSLLLTFCISAFHIWAIMIYGPHDEAIAHLLRTAPFQVFSQIYGLQLITSVILYIWSRSAERAFALADRAEERVARAMQEKERRKQDLEKKHRLDTGIQQILQTHVAVANGDLNARAPLHRGHELWPVAGALNNLIARLQRMNHAERELRQQIGKGHVTSQHPIPDLKHATSQHPIPDLKHATDQHPIPETKFTTDQHPVPETKFTTDQYPVPTQRHKKEKRSRWGW
jgi:hypothetical protein